MDKIQTLNFVMYFGVVVGLVHVKVVAQRAGSSAGTKKPLAHSLIIINKESTICVQ